MPVGIYCSVSGCSPRIPSQLRSAWRPADAFFSRDDAHERLLLERVREALRDVVDEDERRGMEQLCVIGPVREDFVTVFDYEPCDPSRHYLDVPSSDIQIIPNCNTWASVGLIQSSSPSPSPSSTHTQEPSSPSSSSSMTTPLPHPKRYNVLTGAYLLLSSHTLPLLLSRLHPSDLWRLAMGLRASHSQGGSGSGFLSTALPTSVVDYGVLERGMGAWPFDLPGWQGAGRAGRGRASGSASGNGLDELRERFGGVKVGGGGGARREEEGRSGEEGGASGIGNNGGGDAEMGMEERRQLATLLIHGGGFWGWMRPDRFPIASSSPYDLPLPCTTIQDWSFPPRPTGSRSRSTTSLTTLPPELLSLIASHLSSPSLFNLASVCRPLRSSLLSPRSLCAWARADMEKRKPWLLPVGEAEWAWWNARRQEAEEEGWEWGYWCRAVKGRNPSMRNRERIWGIVEQLEALVQVRRESWGERRGGGAHVVLHS